MTSEHGIVDRVQKVGQTASTLRQLLENNRDGSFVVSVTENRTRARTRGNKGVVRALGLPAAAFVLSESGDLSDPVASRRDITRAEVVGREASQSKSLAAPLTRSSGVGEVVDDSGFVGEPMNDLLQTKKQNVSENVSLLILQKRNYLR